MSVSPHEIDMILDDPSPIDFDMGGAEGVDFGLDAPVQIVRNNNYEQLDNLPSIEGVPLIGNKTFPQLNMASLTNNEIEALLTL